MTATARLLLWAAWLILLGAIAAWIFAQPHLACWLAASGLGLAALVDLDVRSAAASVLQHSNQPTTQETP